MRRKSLWFWAVTIQLALPVAAFAVLSGIDIARDLTDSSYVGYPLDGVGAALYLAEMWLVVCVVVGLMIGGVRLLEIVVSGRARRRSTG